MGERSAACNSQAGPTKQPAAFAALEGAALVSHSVAEPLRGSGLASDSSRVLVMERSEELVDFALVRHPPVRPSAAGLTARKGVTPVGLS